MKKILLLLLLTLVFCLACCDNKKNDNEEDIISIIGDIQETVEVNTVYTDKGVVYPDGLTLITHNTVDTSKLGQQQINYSVYLDNGELVKDLYRFVTVVDTTAPTYTPNNTGKYYVGSTYSLFDFITAYSDNYDSILGITVSEHSFVFDESGYQSVSISFTDSSGNTSTYSSSVYVELDFEKLIYEKYKNQYGKVSSGETGMGTKYINVKIDSNTSFSYYDSGSLHFVQKVQTGLGEYASIQISADYGEFNNAHISYHISSSGGSSKDYSVGFAYVNALNGPYEVNGFSSTINHLNLDEQEMLTELNDQINMVIQNFKDYMENELNVPLK